MTRYEVEMILSALRPSTLAAIVADVREALPSVARTAFAAKALQELKNLHGEEKAEFLVKQES